MSPMPERSCSSRAPRDATAARWTAIALLGAIAWLAIDLRMTLISVRARAEFPGDGLRLDPAVATAAELELIPGIGPATAGRIVMHRLEHGPGSLLVVDAEGGPRWALDVVPGVGPITARRAAPYLVPASSAGMLDIAAVGR